MSTDIDMERYAYLKNGDVVRQVAELEQLKWRVPEGGPNAFIADFLDSVKDDDVLLLSSDRRNAISYTGRIQAISYNAIPWNDVGLLKPLQRFSVFLRTIFKLLQFHPTRIICGRTGSMLWASYLVSKIYRVPLVHSRHNRLIEEHEKRLYRRIGYFLDIWVITRIHGSVCHGPYLRQQLIDAGVDEGRVFEFDSGNRDFYEHALTASCSEQVRTGKEEFIVLFVGRMEKNKGIVDLFNACKNIGKKYQQLRLVYVGDGEASSLLEGLVEASSLQERVKLLGRIEHEQLGSLMQQCDLLVTPTWSSFPEGRCMTAMEGLVMGIPVVAPDFGPFPYLVEHNINGLLYAPDSVKDLESSILKCVANSELYTKLKAGAQISGQALLDAPTVFSSAVSNAFAEK